MTSLDLAHGMGYVWVVRLSDDHVGQLDPPENDTDIFIYQDAHDDVDAVDSADEEEWNQSPVVVSEMIHHPPSVITPGLAACMSPRLRQASRRYGGPERSLYANPVSSRRNSKPRPGRAHTRLTTPSTT